MKTAKLSHSRSIRLPIDLDQRVSQAIAATGCNASELAALCFGRSLETVTREILAQRSAASAEFLRTCHDSAPDTPAPHPRKH